MSATSLEVELLPDAAGARLAGEIDLAVFDELTERLEPLFERPGDISLDLAGVSFIDSSAIRVFVRLQRSRNGTGTVTLRDPQPHVARVLEVAGVSEVGLKVDRAGG